MAWTKPLSTNEQRLMMSEAESTGLDALGPCPPHLAEAWIDIPLPNNQSNRTKLVYPKSSKDLPLVIYFHGGGLSVGSPDLVLAPARGFASLLNCVVACPTLNQLPESGFPGPVKMAWGVCEWLSDPGNLNGGVLRDAGTSVDLTRGFVIGGLSSGGAAAAVIGGFSALAAGGRANEIKDFARMAPLKASITGIFSGIPFLATKEMLPPQYKALFKSRDEVHDENKAASDAMRRDLESRFDVHSPWFSPLNLPLTDSKALRNHPPKVLIYGGAIDPFRDDSIIYAKWLEQLENVQVRARVLEGEGHNAWVTPAWPASHSRAIKESTIDGMAWLLGVEWDREGELL